MCILPLVGYPRPGRATEPHASTADGWIGERPPGASHLGHSVIAATSFMSAMRPEEVERMSSKSRRILVIEDEPSIRNLVIEYLVEEGYAVHGAGTLTEAAARMAAVLPDLILLDLM